MMQGFVVDILDTLGKHKPELPFILGLDVLMLTVAVLTFVLASRRGHFVLYVSLFALGLAIEQSSIHFGATHCHTLSTLSPLANVSPCSSWNSILFYGPWLYLALFGAPLISGGIAVPSMCAILQMLYGLPYELQGPIFGWWKYHASREIHDGAFLERILNDSVPLMGILFHPVLGFGVSWALRFVGIDMHSSATHTFPRIFFAMVLSPIFALALVLPIRIASYFGVDKYYAIPCVIALVFLLPTILSSARPTIARSSKIDALLVGLIVFIWYAFFLPWAFFYTGMDRNSWTLIASITVAGLVAYFKVAVVLFSGEKKKKRR